MNYIRFYLGLIGCIYALMGSSLLKAEQRPFAISDLSEIKEVGDPQISPGGEWVAFTVGTIEIDANRKREEIRLVKTDGTGQIRTLVEGLSPRWAPNGRMLAYRGGRGNQSGIWLYDVDKRSNRFLVQVHNTDHFLGHRASKNFEWSPDGKWIAYIGAEPAPAEAKDGDVKIVDRILYKTRTSFSDNRLSHVWVVPVSGGQPRVVTPGKWDEHSLTWSPDSKRIAFISNRSEDPDANHWDDLWTVNVATGRVTQLTDTKGAEFQPKWSPDGQEIAFLATMRPVSTKDSPPEDTQLYILPARGGDPRGITHSLDRRVWGISWPRDGEFIYFTANDEGSMFVYRVAVRSKEIDRLTQANATTPQYSVAGKTLVYSQNGVVEPGDIWVATSDGSKPLRITQLNREVEKQTALQDAETFWFNSFDNWQIQGWLMKPVGFDPSREYPIILSVHGGPHGMYGYSFSDQFQLLAAQGYAVVYINPRGSSGYGQAFADGVVRNWGGGDFHDLMAGLDYVLMKNSWLNEQRMGVTGGSYGGFMTNWIITQTDRFKAAVPMRSLSNLISFYGTSLYQLLIEVEFGGLPWDNYALLWHWSPLSHVKNVSTPTLFIHGEADNDVPITQAEEMFIALKKQGVNTVLVRYPDEGHAISQPQHVEDMYRRMLNWFDYYIKEIPPGPTVQPNQK